MEQVELQEAVVEEAKSEILPYELLLMVLANLDTPQLLQVRAVCRQWRDAALDPELWRQRRWYLDYSDAKMPTGLLRLTPCLCSLSLFFSMEQASWALACSTRCATERLRLGGAVLSEHAAAAALVVRHQAGLGRLRYLYVEVPKFPSGAQMFGLFLDVVCRVEGLLEVGFYGEVALEGLPPLPAPDQPVPASLRELVDYSVFPASHLAYLVRCHAPTLETVVLRCWDGHNVKAVGELLSRAGNLADLTCSLMEDMSALQKCTRLTKLHLNVFKSSAAALREAGDFLRHAASLQDLCFDFHDELEGGLADLVGALASPHHAAVEKVTFMLNMDSNGMETLMTERFVGAFSSALPWLPGLREVRVVGAPSASFLDALSPTSAPSLRLLQLCLGDADDPPETPPVVCAHYFAHRADLRALMERHTVLHVLICYDVWCSYDPCETCSHNDCHPQLRAEAESGQDTMLYSHGQGEACGVPHRVSEVLELSRLDFFAVSGISH